MNLPSLEKFAPKVRPGGVIVINTSLVVAGQPSATTARRSRCAARAARRRARAPTAPPTS